MIHPEVHGREVWEAYTHLGYTVGRHGRHIHTLGVHREVWEAYTHPEVHPGRLGRHIYTLRYTQGS